MILYKYNILFKQFLTKVSPGVIPRRPDGGVDIYEVEARLLKGSLHPLHIICAPHSGQNKKFHPPAPNAQFIADQTFFISKFLFFRFLKKPFIIFPGREKKLLEWARIH